MSKREFGFEVSLPDNAIFWLIVGAIVGVLISMLTMLGFANAQSENDNIDAFVYDLYTNWYKSTNKHSQDEWRQFIETIGKLHALCQESQFEDSHESCPAVEEMYEDLYRDDTEQGKSIMNDHLKYLIPRLTELDTDHA